MKIQDIDIARDYLTDGQIVAVPTETVYGLAAMINNEDAIRRVFLTKERPFFDPLIVHVTGIDQAKEYSASWNELAETLANHFWPGPLTIVLPKNKNLISDLITSGLDTVGLRCPNHPLTLNLLSKLEAPLAAPSANKFTKTSPTSADHVLKSFDNEIAVLEGDFCDVGLESTIVEPDPINNKVYILRPGMISHTQIEKILPSDVQVIYQSRENIPGNMKKHYAPEAEFHFLEIGEALDIDPNKKYLELELDSKAQIAARELYSKLHLMDQETIHYFEMKEHHREIEWIPIIDRLRKAAN